MYELNISMINNWVRSNMNESKIKDDKSTIIKKIVWTHIEGERIAQLLLQIKKTITS